MWCRLGNFQGYVDMSPLSLPIFLFKPAVKYYCRVMAQPDSDRGLHYQVNRIPNHCPDPRLMILQWSNITIGSCTIV